MLQHFQTVLKSHDYMMYRACNISQSNYFKKFPTNPRIIITIAPYKSRKLCKTMVKFVLLDTINSLFI